MSLQLCKKLYYDEDPADTVSCVGCPAGRYGTDCDGYRVTGAGSTDWNGCYELSAAYDSDGQPGYALDSTHHLFRHEGKWRLANHAAPQGVYYEHSAAGCNGFLVAGAGSPDWDGCYLADSRYNSDGQTAYAKDSTHQLYRHGGKWRLAHQDTEVYYLHNTQGLNAASIPTSDWEPQAGAGPAPQVFSNEGAEADSIPDLGWEVACPRGFDVSRHDIAAIWLAFFSRCQRYRC